MTLPFFELLQMLHRELITVISSSRLCEKRLLPSVIGEETQLIVLLGPVAGYIRPVLTHSPEAQDPEREERFDNRVPGSGTWCWESVTFWYGSGCGSGSVPLNNGSGCGSGRPKIIRITGGWWYYSIFGA
jgi:hypothetical protein